MTVAVPKMHTLTLSTKQLEEVFDMVASNLVWFQEDLERGNYVDKAHLTMSVVFYQALYSLCEQALEDR